MSDTDETPPSARSRPRRWFSWIWIAPLLAVGIVIWLAIRALAERGPMITISFGDAEGIQAGDTKIRHKDVDLGTVESIYLSRDMSRVFVRARMRRSVTPHLTASTRFWIVRPRVGIGGISGLSTLVSGSYIEMYPGNGKPQRSFVGIDEPAALTPNMPGRSFTLRTDDLGSLTGGSPISYRGVPVGEVEGFQLDASGKQINIYAFIRAPYEQFVTSQTRFWNSGGIDVAVGVQGLRFRASSWQQLISGGVSFDTPDAALNTNESEARHAAHLQFDDASQSLITRVTLEIDPTRVEIVHRRADAAGDPAAALSARLEKLVARGLRAHLVAANFLTGAKVVSLDMVHDAPPARIEQVDGFAELPTTSATDISAILASVQSVLHHIDAAAAGPELG